MFSSDGSVIELYLSPFQYLTGTLKSQFLGTYSMLVWNGPWNSRDFE